MIRTGSMFRRRWPALAAISVLLVVALTVGTLFAANARPQPELPTSGEQQSVADATDPGLAPDLPADPPAPERVLAQPDDNDEEAIDLPPIVKQPPKYPNLDSNLNHLVEEASIGAQRDAGQQPIATGSASGGAAPAGEPVLVTFYIEPDQVADVRQYLEDNDVFVRHVGEDYIEAHVPPGLLGAASERPGVLRVDTVIPPRPAQSRGNVISQGVGLHGAEAWHDAGYQGSGVKVGVIDGGFEGFSQLQQGGELPPNVFARCYFEEPQLPSSRLGDCEVDGVHGTAVAETVIDVAPGAQLYVSNPVSNGDLRSTVEWMANQGVRVINVSLGFRPDGPGDGTSPFSNSPLETIDAAVSAGITWVNSAGNSAQNVWYGTFSDPDDDGYHNYTPTAEANRFDLVKGDVIAAFLRWDDDWGRAGCNLDLILFWWDPNDRRWEPVSADQRVQDGTDESFPLAEFEVEVISADGDGRYSLGIRRVNCPTEPSWIQLITWMDYELEYYSPGHHMGNPEESRNPGMLAVGATHYWDTNTIASYSSRGPTIDGRTKPDITGVACGRSVSIPAEDDSPCWFGGTSQASPHVAGLAALVQQRSPGYTPVQLADYLRQHATERGGAGADNTWGHGLATLPDPSAGSAPTTVSTIADMPLLVGQMSTVDVSMYFSDADGDMLTYMAESSDEMIATATVSGSMLTIEGKMAGTATITVTATDLADSGMSAMQMFDVTVSMELAAPTNIRPNPVGSGIVLVGFDPVAGADGYYIFAGNIDNPDEPTKREVVNNPNATSGGVDGLVIGDEHLIAVASFNGDNLDGKLSEFKMVTVE